MTPVPDSLSHEDAIIISYLEKRKINKEKSYINTTITIRKKIKILTKQGILEHSFFRIKQSEDMIIEILDARTIKSNGVILDFQSSEIKSMESKSQLAGKTKDLFFAIPGIEVGDEVEMICAYRVKNFRANDHIYFHQTIPVLKSTFSIDAPKKLLVKSNIYNGLAIPTIQNLLHSNLISWTSNNNSAVTTDDHLFTYPHLIYQLDYRNLIRIGGHTAFDNWYHLITHLEKSAFRPKIRNQKKFNAQWNEIAKGEVDEVKLLKIIHDYLNQHIAITSLSPNEKSEGIEYFLQTKKADQTTLLKMYFALFEKAKINVKIAIGQTRNIGPIDLRIPTTAQITNFILVAKNEANITIVVPKDEDRHYNLHELPDGLYDTDIYTTSSKKRKKLLKIGIPKKQLRF